MAQVLFYALNVSGKAATGGGKEHYSFYYPKPSSFQQQSKGYLRALIFMEVIISAGFSPRPFFSLFILAEVKHPRPNCAGAGVKPSPQTPEYKKGCRQ